MSKTPPTTHKPGTINGKPQTKPDPNDPRYDLPETYGKGWNH